MRTLPISILLTFCLAASTPLMSVPQERDRGKVPDSVKWNLAEIYPSDAAWREAKQEFLKELPAVEKYQGTLGKSADRLLGCLDLMGRLNKEVARL
jgi:oligoendopeptidase F